MDGWPEVKCPLCKQDATIDPNRRGDAARFACPRCGNYAVGGSLLSVLERDDEPHFLLSGVTRNATERGEELPVLTFVGKKEIECRPPKTIEEKLRCLLEVIKRRSGSHGEVVVIDRETDYPLVYGRNESELAYFLKIMQKHGWITHDDEPETSRCVLTPEGWAEFDTGRAAETGLTPSEVKPMVLPESTKKVPTSFVSYSWDDEKHKDWVKGLAARLRGEGVNVTLDRWAVAPGDQLPGFMEKAVRENDFVLIVCTPNYKLRADGRTGGVGYEGDIMTGEVFSGKDHRKFIPVLRSGTWGDASPSWLRGKYGIDLRGDPYPEAHYDDLLNTLHGTREQAPPVGARPAKTSGVAGEDYGAYTPPHTHDTGPIQITGIIANEVGTPRNDGTQGSALYKVPFRLSRRPSADWAALFIQTWDSPPSYSTMHRPGIARVEVDRVILDGTTVEEVERYHRGTLKLVVGRVNELMVEHEAGLRREEEMRAEQDRRHRQSVEEAAKRINFD